ncbi:MAG: ammonium transporter [Actinomycetia bacterium]|nr:ammonium transporter [Actinomycetes bacterium]
MESGDIAWMLISTALVVFMVPGLALFYGGGLIGNFDYVGLDELNGDTETLVFVAFLMTFASITPALISGAVADRMRFSAWVVFVILWSVLVYTPVTYWVYRGWHHTVLDPAALDFAGGTAIHINAGVAALAVVLVLGPRRGLGHEEMAPHNRIVLLIGTGMLWFGWFGFNAGSAGAADGAAVQALLNTFVAGAICYYAVTFKEKLGYDDSLDVVGIHGVGGIVGGLLLGLFADSRVNAGGTDGVFFGQPSFLLSQVISMVSVIVFSFVVTYAIAKGLDKTLGLRVSEEEEYTGLDISLHGEQVYGEAFLGAAEGL